MGTEVKFSDINISFLLHQVILHFALNLNITIQIGLVAGLTVFQISAQHKAVIVLGKFYMTDRELITEYILQGIKYCSLVEIKLSTSNQVIKGRILDQDVFRNGLSEFQNELRGIVYPHLKQESPQKVTIQIHDENTTLSNEVLDAVKLNLSMLPPQIKIIYPKDIFSIKKLED